MTQTLKQIKSDQKYWEELAPSGFKLVGWTYRDTATLFTPSGRAWSVYAELLQQIRDSYQNVKAS